MQATYAPSLVCACCSSPSPRLLTRAQHNDDSESAPSREHVVARSLPPTSSCVRRSRHRPARGLLDRHASCRPTPPRLCACCTSPSPRLLTQAQYNDDGESAPSREHVVARSFAADLVVRAPISQSTRAWSSRPPRLVPTDGGPPLRLLHLNIATFAHSSYALTFSKSPASVVGDLEGAFGVVLRNSLSVAKGFPWGVLAGAPEYEGLGYSRLATEVTKGRLRQSADLPPETTLIVQ